MSNFLTLHTTVKELTEDPLVAEVKKEMYKDLAPIVGINATDLGRAFENLSVTIENLPLLDRLMAQAGPDVLAWFVDTSELSYKDELREKFFEDVRIDEDLFEGHNDEDEEEGSLDAHLLKIDKLIDAKQTLRFPKIIMFFWYLEKKEGRKIAEGYLSQTLYTLALHELITKKCLSKRLVFEDALVKELHPAFKDFLHAIQVVDDQPKGEPLDKTCGTVKQKVQGVEAGLVTLGAKRIQKTEKTRGKELRYFATDLIRADRFTKLAKKLLDACPKGTRLT